VYLGRVTIGKDQEAFVSRLKQERERRGLTLKAIADSTKIKQSLLAALERGDVSQWPSGLFRRAYVRHYAAAVGLPAEPLVTEFGRLFPDSDDTMPATIEIGLQAGGRPAGPPMVPAAPRPANPPLNRLRAAAFDLGLVVLASAAIALATGAAAWQPLGVVASAYLLMTTVVLGRSLGGWLLPRSDRWLAGSPSTDTAGEIRPEARAGPTRLALHSPRANGAGATGAARRAS
jgi:transcriptional regulator with XRE-family HTH domain